jgi:hypothetical protein
VTNHFFSQVSIVAAYIKERTKNAQFIVISLRNNMFELASRLVGVYKVNHMVRLKHPSDFSISSVKQLLTFFTDEECDSREQRLHHRTVERVLVFCAVDLFRTRDDVHDTGYG